MPDIQNWLPLEKKDFDDTEKVTTIDSFIYRFTKIQDKLEKFELIDSADMWIEAINLSITSYLKMKKVYTQMLNATGVC